MRKLQFTRTLFTYLSAFYTTSFTTSKKIKIAICEAKNLLITPPYLTSPPYAIGRLNDKR